jgi:hypothetical protein
MITGYVFLRVRGRFNNMSLICAHTPAEEKNGNIKDTFYDAVEKAFSHCPRNDVRIILGDLDDGTETVYKSRKGRI